jgi:hypothetical protein
MSRKILCPKCNDAISKLAEKYNELFESKNGTSLLEMKCDDCGRDIEINENCFAAVLLPSEYHPNYQMQKPENWASIYIQ